MRCRDLFHARLIAAVATAVLSGVPAAGAQEAVAHEPPSFHTDERPFLSENAAAMDRMMTDMVAAPTGDIDADFAAMMIPHHQGAIDMAVAYLRYGKNEQLRRLAQEIVVEQQQEIAAMKLARGEPLPRSLPALTQPEATTPSGEESSEAHKHNHSTKSYGAMPSETGIK
jgi:hypothetical protein